MSADFRHTDLYRRTVLDHSRHPRHFHRMAEASSQSTGHNQLCGDKVTIYVRLSDDTVSDVSFEGAGCAISIASASMLTDMVRNQSTSEVRRMIESVCNSFEGRSDDLPDNVELAALVGVRQYPSRIRCATLPWQALKAAIGKANRMVTRE